jgi:hypothetical protein
MSASATTLRGCQGFGSIEPTGTSLAVIGGVLGAIVGRELADWRIGDALEVAFRALETGLHLPVFQAPAAALPAVQPAQGASGSSS